MWERELRKIKGLYDNRMRASQQKSAKMEQALTNQTYQVRGQNNNIFYFDLISGNKIAMVPRQECKYNFSGFLRRKSLGLSQ